MAIVEQTDYNFITAAIEMTLKERIRDIADEELEAAKTRIDQRVKDEVDRIALRAMAEYDISMRGETLTISVRKAL